MATNYGSDTQCVTDLSLVDVLVTDPRQLIGERIARRWQTARGALSLINDDPNGGIDVNQFINAQMSPSAIQIAQSQLLSEALKDQEVQSGSVTLTLSNGGQLSINAHFQSAVGPFSLVLGVNELTSDLILSFQ